MQSGGIDYDILSGLKLFDFGLTLKVPNCQVKLSLSSKCIGLACEDERSITAELSEDKLKISLRVNIDQISLQGAN